MDAWVDDIGAYTVFSRPCSLETARIHRRSASVPDKAPSGVFLHCRRKRSMVCQRCDAARIKERQVTSPAFEGFNTLTELAEEGSAVSDSGSCYSMLAPKNCWMWSVGIDSGSKIQGACHRCARMYPSIRGPKHFVRIHLVSRGWTLALATSKAFKAFQW